MNNSEAYHLAYTFLAVLDDLLQARYHFRDTNGRLILTLDQATTAITTGRWPKWPPPLTADLPLAIQLPVPKEQL